MEILIEWITKPIINWSVADLFIIGAETSVIVLIAKVIKLIIKRTRLFKKNLIKPK